MPGAEPYFNIRGVWTSEMMNRLTIDQARQTLTHQNLKQALSQKNPWRQRCIRDHPRFTSDIAPQAKQLENAIEGQKKNLVKVNESINKIDSKTN